MSDKSISALRTKKKAKPGIDHIWPWARHSCIALAMAASMQVIAQQPINIPAQPLADALKQLGEKTGLQIIYDAAIIKGLNSQSAQGSNSQEVLRQLLGNTNIKYTISGNSVTLVKPENGVTTLPPVKISDTVLNATTENTGSYTPTGPISTATPLGLTLKETPQSVSVMTSQRMKDQSLLSIGDVLEQTPGITLASTGTERVQATSRGYQVTNYQLDGVNTHSDFGGAAGPASQSLANIAMYDRIEVVRGASGLTSGAGDPSGVINMVRKKPTDELQIAFEAALGTWGKKLAIFDASNSISSNNTVRGRVVLSGQDADSYIDHYNRDEELIYAVVDADLTNTTKLTIGADHQQTESTGHTVYGGFPLWFSNGEQTDLPVSISLASKDNQFETKSTTTFVALEQQLPGDWLLKIAGTNGESSQSEELVYLDPNGRFADSVTGDGLLLDAAGRTYDTHFKSADINVRGSFSLFDRKHEAVLGFAYEDYKKIADGFFDTSGLGDQPANLYTWDRSGVAVFDLKAVDWDAYREQYSFYAAGNFRITDNVKFIAGTRVINYEDSLYTANIYGYLNKPSSSEKGVFAPYGGILYDISDAHTLYTSYTTIYQPQYARDTNGDLIDPREGSNYELGIKSTWLDDTFNTAAAIYQIDQDNLTETDPAYILVPGTTSEYASRVIPGAKTQGIDLEASGAFTSNWQISASWTYSVTENGDGDRVRTTFPRHIAKLWTTYRLPGEWDRLTVGGGVNWQSKIYGSVFSWTLDRDLYWEQKNYTVANLMARYDFSEYLSVSINANNIFDKKYIASATDWWYSGNYGAPRNVLVTANFKFK